MFGKLSHRLCIRLQKWCILDLHNGYVFVQEDKDRNAAWLMPLTLYARWCFFMFRQDDVHWVPFQGSVAEAVEAYRRLHSELLPSHLKRFSAKSRWRSFELPYAYCTLKAKCFAEGIGLSLVVCDAAQMYEEISPRMVFEAVDLLITLAKNRLGKFLFEQVRGVPIGGDLGHPWLDVWLFDDRGRLGIRADGVEVAWRAAGGQGYPTKHRLKPYLGPAACCQAELRSLAAGRLVRWKSMDLQSQRLREAVATELQVWVLYGYP
ncbi:unnamed protein product, partial [Symbiodinium necroappetens]